MGVVFVDLVAWTLPEEDNQGFDIAVVGVGPDVLRIFRRDGLKGDKRKEVLLGEKFNHLAELEGIAGSATFIAESTLSFF